VGWVEGLFGKTVAVDTAPLVFYIEDHPEYADRLEPFFQAVVEGRIAMVTAVVTLLEVLVHPLRRGDEALAHADNDFLLASSGVTTVPVDEAIAQAAAELRSGSKLKTPDAIHLATAMDRKADAFLTSDRDFDGAASMPILRVSELVD
jgi:predicted nucleic acid-binding protein